MTIEVFVAMYFTIAAAVFLLVTTTYSELKDEYTFGTLLTAYLVLSLVWPVTIIVSIFDLMRR